MTQAYVETAVRNEIARVRNARAEAAERQRDELLDVILDQAKRSLMSIPHDIWAAAVRISKEISL